MARVKLAYLTAIHLVWLGTVCCLTNLEVYNLLKEHATDLKIEPKLNATSCERQIDSDPRIDETLCDDVINVPGGPKDEFDENYFLQNIGFIPYESDDECDSIGHPNERSVDESQEQVDKYCHYRQYLIHGLHDDENGLQCHHHHHHHGHHHHHHGHHHHHCHHHGHHHHHHHHHGHHHNHHHDHHHHHHCHHHDYVKCSCQRRECSCCLRHKFRFNHCSHSTTFTLKVDHLQPLCYNLRLGEGTAKVCINFYSVDKSRKRVCTRLTGVWTIGNKETKIDMNVGCMVLSFSRNTDLMDILRNEKFWREMVIDQKFEEE